MSGRDLAAVALLGAGAWALWRYSGGRLPDDLSTAAGGLPWAPGGQSDASGPDYTAATAARESGGRILAKNPRSSASGLYQFTKATWTSLGGAWGSDPAKAFGGLTPSLAEQTARFERLTANNAAGLARAGITATAGALYAAHFLGLSRALKVLAAPPTSPLAAVLPAAVLAANPQLRGLSVAGFLQWARGQA